MPVRLIASQLGSFEVHLLLLRVYLTLSLVIIIVIVHLCILFVEWEKETTETYNQGIYLEISTDPLLSNIPHADVKRNFHVIVLRIKRKEYFYDNIIAHSLNKRTIVVRTEYVQPNRWDQI